jgi:hypothetical protein
LTPILLPLYAHPEVAPAAWRAAASLAGELSVVVRDARNPGVAAAAARLTAAGVPVLGLVDAGFATRRVAELAAEVTGWSGRPVSGLFLDQAPTSPFCLGPVALAVRAARRAGLSTVVLNPGVPPDPLYRDLGVPICTFEGAWTDYRRWSGAGSRPGDGHLVHSVPAGSVAAAWALLRQRRAGWGLVTDRTPPDVYAGYPGWLTAPVPTG